jgi:hypothetical protein
MTLCVFLFLFNAAEGFQTVHTHAHRIVFRLFFFWNKVPLVRSKGVLEMVYHMQGYQLSGVCPTSSTTYKISSVSDWVIYDIYARWQWSL